MAFFGDLVEKDQFSNTDAWARLSDSTDIKAMAIVFAMVGTVWLFGYILGSLLFASGFYLLRGVEKRWVAAVLSISIAVVAMILQSKLNIQLPEGQFNIPIGL